ncbi:MAG: hypothetical protein ICV51_03705 [Flavisolibacter sp.]|nr:hypothetical protein [Flavisolibacter sp.]
MIRLGIVLLLLALFSCNNKKESTTEEEETGFDYASFAKRFKEVSLPYSLSDSALVNNNDTSAIRNPIFNQFIPDSIKTKLFGTKNRIRLIPMVRLSVPKGESYFIVKATGAKRKAALLVTFDKQQQYVATLPFLVPDTDPTTTQVSSIDKAYSISRAITRKSKDDVITEGKEVYAFNAAAKQFTLIMTDVLDEQARELINPIDTFSRKHKWAGDYMRNKKNIVSIRDGRSEHEFLFFIHFEKEEGDCTGELRGSALMTSTTTAVYRLGGDPCVLEFTFRPSSVTLREVEGCGSHRGVRCLFEGTYPKKREAKPKTNASSDKRTK